MSNEVIKIVREGDEFRHLFPRPIFPNITSIPIFSCEAIFTGEVSQVEEGDEEARFYFFRLLQWKEGRGDPVWRCELPDNGLYTITIQGEQGECQFSPKVPTVKLVEVYEDPTRYGLGEIWKIKG